MIFQSARFFGSFQEVLDVLSSDPFISTEIYAANVLDYVSKSKYIVVDEFATSAFDLVFEIADSLRPRPPTLLTRY